MMTVGNQCRRKAVIRKLAPDWITVARNLLRDSIPQVSGQARTCIYGLLYLFSCRMCVANGNMHAPSGQFRDIVGGFVVMGGQGNHADEPIGGFLPSTELRNRWRAHNSSGMRPR